MRPAGKHRDDVRNWAPLFFYNPGDAWIYMRESYEDVSERSYDSHNAAKLAYYSFEIAQLGASLMPKNQYQQANIGYPPDEAGAQGEVGWPAEPRNKFGDERVMDVRGPNLANLKPSDWAIDSTPGFN
jgi:hypothetical protein